MIQDSVSRPSAAIAFSSVAHFYTHVVMLLFPTVVLVLDDVFGQPYEQLIGLLLPGYVLFGLAALPAGWLGDRWSSRGMMTVFFFGTGTATFLTGFASSPLWIGIGLTFIGLFAAIYHPVGTSFIVRHAVNRGRALGANGVFGTTGVALGPVIAGVLAASFGWRMAFFIPGVVGVATGIAFMLLTPSERHGEGGGASSVEPFTISRRTAVRALGVLAFTIMCAGFIAQAFLVGLPKVFEDRMASIGVTDLTDNAFLVSAALLIGASGQLIGGSLADRFPIKRVYIAMQCLLLPSAVIAASLNGVPLIVAAILIQLFMTSALPAENCLVARFCPSDWHARAYGGKFVLGLGVSSLAIPMIGWIYGATGGFYWYFMALGMFSLLIVCAAVFLPGEREAAASIAVGAAAE